jgi:Ca2+-binding RTX toxin-like protein
LNRPVAWRLGLSTCLVLAPLLIGAAPADAVTNTAPDCSQTAQVGFTADAIVAGGNQTPSNLDVVWPCTDAEGDALDVTAVTPGSHGTTVIEPADPTMGLDTSYVQYTPVEGFYGRDQLEATVSDGSLTTQETIYVHVIDPNDYLDCGPTVAHTEKQAGESADYDLYCDSSAAAPITYVIDSVDPVDQASHVTVDNVNGLLSFDAEITGSQVTVALTATDETSASDTFSVVLDNQHDPACTAATDETGDYVTLEQRSSNHDSFTQNLGCSDPDGTPLSYTAPTYFPSNPDPTDPGTLTVSDTGIVTFVPTDPDWTGRAYYTSGEVTDGNDGYHGFGILVDRYQQADMSVAFSATPSTVAIGSSYTAGMHVMNAGPDPVSGVYIEIGLPEGSVLGTLPSACHGGNGWLECDYDTIAANADFNVAIPLTAGPGSVAGVSQIGAQYFGANLRNTNSANDMSAANVTLTSASGPGTANDVVRGSVAGTTISTGAGDDLVDGGAGNDLLLLGLGNDCGEGGSGNDTVRGNAGNDAVYGDGGPCLPGTASRAGKDRLFGGLGDDLLNGGRGRDILVGGPGRDRFVGGGGNDVIRARDHVGRERINCGAGRDVVRADKADLVARNCEEVHRR